jgi:adenine-specific DNA-methyltransferase
LPELLWDGKYDSAGRRVAPPRVALPLQPIETVNESSQDRQRSLDLFSGSRDETWRNRLIWGDNKYILPALLAAVSGSVDLIYIDPPFGTGQDFTFTAEVPDADLEFLKQPSVLEQKAYRDTWGKGLDGYLAMISERIALMYDLLAPTGVFAVHVDWRASAYYRLVLDEIFGKANFVNELIWRYGKMANPSKRFSHSHDQVIVYHKGDDYPFNVQSGGVSEYRNRYERFVEPDNTVRFGRMADSKDQLIALRVNKLQKELGRAMRPDDVLFDFNTEAKVYDDVFTDISIVKGNSEERTAYPTQKPEGLLQRIIAAYTNDNAVVADFFAGSGTTAVAAERLGRRWIVCDLSRFAIHTTRKRLLSIANVRPFDVLNLGKYERQLWQQAEFGDQAEERALAYRKFMIDLYRATSIEGYLFLHGVKAGRFVHIGTVDAPVTISDVRQIVEEFGAAVGTGSGAPSTNGIDVLGWEFAFELNELAKQEAARGNVDLRFVRIPREVLDKRAVASGDVHFFELAALAVAVSVDRRTVTVEIADFVIPADDVPADVQRQIDHWSQWIDYWAVDWDNKGDTFHNEWQTYRTKKNPDLALSFGHEYPAGGTYRVVIKVIDILGNDTTKTVEVEVK